MHNLLTIHLEHLYLRQHVVQKQALMQSNLHVANMAFICSFVWYLALVWQVTPEDMSCSAPYNANNPWRLAKSPLKVQNAARPPCQGNLTCRTKACR